MMRKFEKGEKPDTQFSLKPNPNNLLLFLIHGDQISDFCEGSLIKKTCCIIPAKTCAKGHDTFITCSVIIYSRPFPLKWKAMNLFSPV